MKAIRVEQSGGKGEELLKEQRQRAAAVRQKLKVRTT